MKSAKAYIYGFLLAIPFIGLLFYFLNPLLNSPQCPLNFTQEQVDASRCIVGANIGGFPIFIILSIGVWLVATLLVSWFINKKKDSIRNPSR